jgi:hypothetical protein
MDVAVKSFLSRSLRSLILGGVFTYFYCEIHRFLFFARVAAGTGICQGGGRRVVNLGPR